MLVLVMVRTFAFPLISFNNSDPGLDLSSAIKQHRHHLRGAPAVLPSSVCLQPPTSSPETESHRGRAPQQFKIHESSGCSGFCSLHALEVAAC